MKRLFVFVLIVMFIQRSFCQTEKFDIVTYTPPKDFIKETKQGVVVYTHLNATTGGFCIIAIYANTASTGDEQKDFKNKWKELVATPYKVEANPKTETQSTTDGWKVVASVAPVKQDGIDFYIILSVFSGFGKTTSIMVNLNDQSYVGQVDALLEGMQLDKTLVAPNPVNNQNSQAGKFRSMIYSTPKGWKEQQYQKGVLLTPSNLPAKEHLDIQIMEPLNFSGTLDEALQKSYDEACILMNVTKMNEVGGGNYTKLNAKKSYKGWEYIRASGGIRVENSGEYGLDLFVIKINNRFERVAVLKSRNSCNLSRYYPTDRLTYLYDVEDFLFGLQFTDWKEPVVTMGTVNGSGITGIWQGISLSVGTPKPGAILGTELKVKQAVFFSNGQVFFGTKFPLEGLDELNTWIRTEWNRRDWGTYSFNNGKGVIKMPYGDIPLRMENAKLVITTNQTDHVFIKLNPVDGATFNGTYVFNEWNGMIPTITFTSDGKFIDKGAMWVLYHEYIDCLNIGKVPGSGNYEVKNHSVIFNYTDGRKIKLAFLGAGYDKKDKSPATLSISSNEDQMKRQ